MRLVVAITLWKRPDLTDIVLDHYRRMRDSAAGDVELHLVAVGSEGRVTRELARRHDFTYIEFPNEPVGEKGNAAVRWARSVAPDGLVLVNSDDLLSPELPRAYVERLRDGHHFFGLRDSHVFDLPSRRFGTWPGYEASYMQYRVGEPAGCARCFSRHLLERTGWRLWPARPQRNSSLDFWCTRFVGLFGFEPTAWTMRELGVRALQVKSNVNITRLGRLPLVDLVGGEGLWPRVEEIAGEESTARLRALAPTIDPEPDEYVYESADRAPITRVDDIQPIELREETAAGLRAMKESVDEAADVPVASIVINNHEYGAYLGEAVDSALGQSTAGVEVVVVDDGSTDDSPEILDGYGHDVVAVHKPNGGQASTFNAGVATSRGSLVCFLDSDDVCHPDRVRELVRLAATTPSVRPRVFHHRLEEFDARSADTRAMPERFVGIDLEPRPGDPVCISTPDAATAFARRTAYLPFLGSPTSGVAADRALVERLFPIPETHAVGADSVVLRGSLLVADVFATYAVLGRRRLHGANHSATVQKHLVDAPFLHSMDRFLNGILAEAGEPPLISVFESRGATRYFQHVRSARGLLRLAVRVPCREPGRSSLSYAWSNVRAALGIVFSRGPA